MVSTDVGEQLRRAREEKGLSIQELSKITKISPPVLRAIEANDEGHLPGGIFTRSFVRAYAKEVGLDADAIVPAYVGQFESQPEVPAWTESESREYDPPAEPRRVELEDHHGHVVATVVLVICALALLGFLQRRSSLRSRVDPVVEAQDAAPAAPRIASVQDAAAVGTAGTAPPAPAVAAARPDALKIALQPRGECWVSAAGTDGRLYVYRMMKAGEQETIDGAGVMLRVGDPAAFAFSINGKPGRTLGPAGSPTSVQITLDNYQEYLAP
jgi:transcriptional regulator with XRE-family HTH domain